MDTSIEPLRALVPFLAIFGLTFFNPVGETVVLRSDGSQLRAFVPTMLRERFRDLSCGDALPGPTLIVDPLAAEPASFVVSPRGFRLIEIDRDGRVVGIASRLDVFNLRRRGVRAVLFVPTASKFAIRPHATIVMTALPSMEAVRTGPVPRCSSPPRR